jgi:hypothetical protein
LDDIQAKVLLFTVTSTALLEISISSNSRRLLQFLYRRKEENLIEKPYPLLYGEIHTESKRNIPMEWWNRRRSLFTYTLIYYPQKENHTVCPTEDILPQ